MNDISKFRIAAPQVLETAIVPAVEQPILIQKPHPQEFIQMHAEQWSCSPKPNWFVSHPGLLALVRWVYGLFLLILLLGNRRLRLSSNKPGPNGGV